MMVIFAAKCMAEVIEPTCLSEHGGPATCTLNVAWAKSLLKRMNFTKRRASTNSTNHTRDVKEMQIKFLVS